MPGLRWAVFSLVLAVVLAALPAGIGLHLRGQARAATELRLGGAQAQVTEAILSGSGGRGHCEVHKVAVRFTPRNDVEVRAFLLGVTPEGRARCDTAPAPADSRYAVPFRVLYDPQRPERVIAVRDVDATEDVPYGTLFVLAAGVAALGLMGATAIGLRALWPMPRRRTRRRS
ncbi:MAG: hypothetical protein U0Q15_11065 [Kineosporiaceae bacterium]